MKWQKKQKASRTKHHQKALADSNAKLAYIYFLLAESSFKCPEMGKNKTKIIVFPYISRAIDFPFDSFFLSQKQLLIQRWKEDLSGMKIFVCN